MSRSAVHPSDKLRDGLNTSTRATIGLFSHHWLAICTLALCTPALLTVLLILRLGNGALEQLLTLWGCSAPELAYLYTVLHVYVLFLGLVICG